MSQIKDAFASISDLTTWFNDQSGVPLTLAFVPELIGLRWRYFKENWEFISSELIKKQDSYSQPATLGKQIEKLGTLIRIQRGTAGDKINPFLRSTTLLDYYAVWENILVDSVPLTKQETKLVDDKLSRIRKFTITDFQNIRKAAVAARDEIADVTGLNDVDYDRILRRSPNAKLRIARIRDVGDMQNIQDTIISLDFILANTASLNTVNVDPFALAKLNANNPEIEITSSSGGRLVRMDFGDSLQDLARKFLNDADRWLEIAIANGLKKPYVDEFGTTIPLVANASGSQINLSKTDILGLSNISKLYVNQIILLQSDAVKFPDQRSIISIREIPISGEIIIELSGDPNLGQFQVSDNANIRVFKPNTISSRFLVMIPSGDASSSGSKKEIPFFLLSKPEDEKKAGVDLLLNSKNDLDFTAVGDFQLSYGLVNATQAMQFKMQVEKGEINRHPFYGLPLVIGQVASDPQAVKDTLTQGIRDMVANDARFDRIETISVNVSLGSAIISLVVRLAGGGNTLLPINFIVNTG